MMKRGIVPRSNGLAPDVNRILFVRNLPYKISAEDMYAIFGKYGAIRQIRLGDANLTRGTAYVVYEDILDAKEAVESLSGFNVAGRYIIVSYYQQTRRYKRSGSEQKYEAKRVKTQDGAVERDS